MTNISIQLPSDFGDELRELIKAELREGIRELADELQPAKDFLTQKQVLEWLGISYGSFQKLRERGLEGYRFDRKTLYSRREIEKLLTGEMLRTKPIRG